MHAVHEPKVRSAPFITTHHRVDRVAGGGQNLNAPLTARSSCCLMQAFIDYSEGRVRSGGVCHLASQNSPTICVSSRARARAALLRGEGRGRFLTITQTAIQIGGMGSARPSRSRAARPSRTDPSPARQGVRCHRPDHAKQQTVDVAERRATGFADRSSRRGLPPGKRVAGHGLWEMDRRSPEPLSAPSGSGWHLARYH